MSSISAFLFSEKYLWAFRFRVIAPRPKVLQNAARTQRRAVLDVHPHLVRVFQFLAQMARVMGRGLGHCIAVMSVGVVSLASESGIGHYSDSTLCTASEAAALGSGSLIKHDSI